MPYRLIIITPFLFGILGCVYENEPRPRIVYNPGVIQPQVELPPLLNIPEIPKTRAPENVPPTWLPPSKLERSWKAIIIHHSATDYGNAAIFDRWHREGNHWEGVGYDFVIGNGSNSPDGGVEVTFRWRQQMTGAHCKTPDNWANREAIGICLVGNFNKTRPTKTQMESLGKLVRFLQTRYRIPQQKIYGHKDTPGARITECPGSQFSLRQLFEEMDSRSLLP